GLVHRRDPGPPGRGERGGRRAGPVPAPEPRIRGARQPWCDHGRQPQHAAHGDVPGLAGHRGRARQARVRVRPRRVGRGGAPRPAHARGRAHHGALPGRNGAMTDLNRSQHHRALWCGGWLLLASGVLLLCGVGVGSTGFESVLRMWDEPVARQIVWDIRLPRTLGAWLAGALLGLAGAVAQGLFRNPLADPYLLGSASGAALGGAVAMALFGSSPLATQWFARLGVTGMAFI